MQLAKLELLLQINNRGSFLTIVLLLFRFVSGYFKNQSIMIDYERRPFSELTKNKLFEMLDRSFSETGSIGSCQLENFIAFVMKKKVQICSRRGRAITADPLSA